LYLGEPLAREATGDSVSYVPLSLPEACALVANRRLAFDAAMVATSLPDAQGRVSFGTAVGITPAVLRCVPLAIHEQVPAMPVTAGDTLWPADAFSAVVVSDRALPEFRHQRDDARSARIGRYVSRLVEDGATLQVGPGRVPNGALRFLTERRDLRILTDLLSEEISALVESGAVRADPGGAPAPSADPDVMASFCTGTAQLFARLNRNPRYTFWPIEVVNVFDRRVDRTRRLQRRPRVHFQPTLRTGQQRSAVGRERQRRHRRAESATSKRAGSVSTWRAGSVSDRSTRSVSDRSRQHNVYRQHQGEQHGSLMCWALAGVRRPWWPDVFVTQPPSTAGPTGPAGT
ncbi:MAG: hypothetical protein L0271_05525, partial [Gemmatimonadetes bacterium]|nr:hypothetical protein [Gemmatimonadota bacterium]